VGATTSSLAAERASRVTRGPAADARSSGAWLANLLIYEAPKSGSLIAPSRPRGMPGL